MHCLLEKNLNRPFFFFSLNCIRKKDILGRIVATYCKLERGFKGSYSH